MSGKHVERSLLGGSRDLVSRLITPITHIVALSIPITNLLTKSPQPSKYLELYRLSVDKLLNGCVAVEEIAFFKRLSG